MPSLTGDAFWMPGRIPAGSAPTVAATAVPGTWDIGLGRRATTDILGPRAARIGSFSGATWT